MTLETEISTPVDEVADDTSTQVEPAKNAETSTVEPEVTETPAETETETLPEPTTPEILYAGKYKSVEELEKGYNEAQKFVNKASEFEKKYNELIEKQAKEAEKIELEKLQQAQYRGFSSVEQQEIADKVQLAEFEYYANNLNTISPENAQYVKDMLLQYYQTANTAYLDEAKKYFPSSFIENVAQVKYQLQNQLNQELEASRKAKYDEQASKLADTLKTDFADFLADIETNSGKAQALKSFCDAGSINSKEDMQIFQDIYSQIAKYERDMALKELEAQKVIDETKNKAVIVSTSEVSTDANRLKESYSQKDIREMPPEEFDKLYTEYGLKFVSRIKE